jgi:hypothetical protein
LNTIESGDFAGYVSERMNDDWFKSIES